MANLKKLNDEELLEQTDSAVEVEKEAVNNTTRHFKEIYLRRAYLPTYPNMFEFLTKRYGYCDGSAQLRIGTIELIRQVPAVQEKIETGELSMTAAANIRTFLRAEQNAKRPYSQNAKIELVEACLGKSTREVQKEFVRRNPEIEKRDSVRYTSESRVRIEVSFSEVTLKNLNDLRDILSHVDPNMSLGSLIERLAEDGLDKYSAQRKAARAKRRAERKALENAVIAETAAAAKDVTKKRSAEEGAEEEGAAEETARAKRGAENCAEQLARANWSELLHAHEVTPAATRAAKRTRYITASEKHRVANDGKGCAFTDAKTGRRCSSTKFLQLDHVEPFASGGANAAENLRWMCGAHNRFRSGSERWH